MSDVAEFIMPSPEKAAWVIDIAQGTVSWSNAIAKQRFGDALGYDRNGLLFIDRALKQDLHEFLSRANASEPLCFHWLMRDVDQCLHRCVAKVIALGEKTHGFSVEASPCPPHMAQQLPRTYAHSSLSERLNSIVLMTFTGSGQQHFFSQKACALFTNVGHVKELFAVASAANHFWTRLQSGTVVDQEIRLATVEGIRWFRVEAQRNQQTGMIDIYAQDIQELRDYEVALYRLQNYDELTDLPNRHLLYQQLERAHKMATQRQRRYGILYLDLDGFKVVNDTFGHRLGDQLLQEVANRIKATIPSRSCLYRLGGDEFVVVLEHVQGVDELERIAHSINAAAATPYPVSDLEMMITTSIGIACYPEHGDGIDALLKNADAAMYRSKSITHNGFHVYHKQLTDRYSAYMTLGGGLRRAIEEGQFELYFQPKLRASDEVIVGAEALIRWQHPEWGCISPDQFIPIAEESGLILPLGEWVIRQACQQIKQWREQGLPALAISVNLSGRQFMQPDLVEMVRKILQETGVDPRYLELELTESMLMSDADETIEKLHDFRKMGLTLSIDDFGTGYSSLAYLKKFPIQALKIDRSFIQDLSRDSDDDAIVKATIAMASSLNLKVIAEGVENRDQLQVLTDYRCEEVQGYLFAKPMSNKEFAHYLAQQNIVHNDDQITDSDA
ncbi:putative bifunctional diguanylate cyclase/phosphodiesterase [Marinomonas ostreistagni]|uniref:putative bifunctional diguanylate cyclase/phosphodiesterase n=1 Tax=Marinomonas ostreistagni TaxID=359209 RepID=UPI0019511136|nr:EAL domain-containing protein [Marinomonas ostreistagni]MBM6551952.1 EAL domain-containing protein [Marinomonas ostreistagni]